jgi:hypothetical protein
MRWMFDQGRNVASLTTKQVIEQGYPVLQVIHYSDDQSWAFMCGTTSEPADARLVSMEQVVSTDESLHDISDLPPGWIATRSSSRAEWVRERDDEI